MVFDPFWSENGYRFLPFGSEIGQGFTVLSGEIGYVLSSLNILHLFAPSGLKFGKGFKKDTSHLHTNFPEGNEVSIIAGYPQDDDRRDMTASHPYCPCCSFLGTRVLRHQYIKRAHRVKNSIKYSADHPQP